MTGARRISALALGILCLALVSVFLFMYLGGDDGEAVELTEALPNARAANGGPETGGEPVESGTAAPDSQEEAPTPLPRVYVAGEVREPGVYTMPPDGRLADAVEAAGGATPAADLEAVNLAIRVEDEGYYYIPPKIPPKVAVPTAGPSPETNPETAPETPSDAPQETSDVDPEGGPLPDDRFPDAATNRPSEPSPEVPDAREEDTTEDTTEDTGLVNLNTATQSDLESLPGIGPARAQAIIAFREQNGFFVAVEEITAVSGIGQGILDNLQGLITVDDAP